MSEPQLHQIYYSAQTLAGLDPGFSPLDNSANERPDWREYWPIRRFLLQSELEADTYYGFFSPKFRQKTGLDAQAVRDFIAQQGDGSDVVSFSPFFDQMALSLNIMEQAVGQHGECRDSMSQCAALVAPEFRIDRSVTTAANTILCNFFAAKPAFWREWLAQCERIYRLAEESATPLGRELNQVVAHGAGTAPLKVFVIERVATLMLWAQPKWRVRAYDPALLPPSPGPLAKTLSIADLSFLEALKIAYERSGLERFLTLYGQLRGRFIQRPVPGGGTAAARVASEPAAKGAAAPQAAAPSIAPPVALSAALPTAPSAAPSTAPPAVPPTTPLIDQARIRVVCATRKDRDAFFAETALGRSLSLHRPSAVELRLFPGNRQGLPEVYNTAISESGKGDVILLFVHDDVHLCDFHWAERLREGLAAFDVVGLAGNRRRVPGQPAWLFTDETLTRDSRDHLSGIVGHGRALPLDGVNDYGPSGKPVKLLDGLFLAVRSDTLRAKSLSFDERFDFHFYDLDFCRQAERAGLSMGTWPISVVHESAGNFANDRWRLSYEAYLEKWRD